MPTNYDLFINYNNFNSACQADEILMLNVQGFSVHWEPSFASLGNHRAAPHYK